jgi:hypothetical protein
MDPDPDPTPDPTHFFIDFKDAKKNIFFTFFSHKLAHRYKHLQSKKLNFWLKFGVKMLFCRHYFSPLNTFMRNGKDPDPDYWIRIREAQKHADPADQDPQHCFILILIPDLFT